MVELPHQELKAAFLASRYVDDIHEEIKTDLNAFILAVLKPEVGRVTVKLKVELQKTIQDEVREQLKQYLTNRIISEVNAGLR
jgi:hypothetical protein